MNKNKCLCCKYFKKEKPNNTTKWNWRCYNSDIVAPKKRKSIKTIKECNVDVVMKPIYEEIQW